MYKDKVEVDIIPVMESGDAKQIKDHGVVKFNTIILGVLHQLYMSKNTLDEFSDIGCLGDLQGIYFSNYVTVSEIATAISANLTKYRANGITVQLINETEESVHLHVTIDGIPNFKFTADLVRTNQSIKIINPVLG